VENQEKSKRKAPRRTRKKAPAALPADYKTPLVRLLEKPYSEWTQKKQREWLDRLPLFPSPRGRKAETDYDSLYHEREMAKLSSGKVPSYTDLASRVSGGPLNANSTLPEDIRQRLIRAYQRRRRLPDPPQD
jgi:hypothetical protein